MTAITLPSTFDTAAAAALRQDLLAAIDAGAPVTIDGEGVGRVGLAGLQILAAARAAAAERGLAFAVDRPSEHLREMASLGGLTSIVDAAG